MKDRLVRQKHVPDFMCNREASAWIALANCVVHGVSDV